MSPAQRSKRSLRPQGPDRDAALLQYRRRAATYDLELAPFEPIRREAIARLALRPGETVLDIGCGTGLSFALLQRGVGARGHVVGIEQSPEMMARARERADALGRRHFSLHSTAAEDTHLQGRADAALFHFTHDVLRRPAALDHLLRHLRPGARIVATGLQWAPAWALPVNLVVWGAALRSVSSLHGLGRPYGLLAARVDVQTVRSLMLGAVFMLTATRRG